MVGANFSLTQDRGFYYQDSAIKAHSLVIATNITSNILEKSLHLDSLQVEVVDPNSYTARLTHELLVTKQIKLRLPAIDVFKKMRAEDLIEIYTPIYQLAAEQDNPLYTVDLYDQISAKKVILSSHGVQQKITQNSLMRPLNPVINAVNLLVTTCNIKLPIGFKVTDNALLHVTGTASYDPSMLKAGRWLGLHLPQVRDFHFAHKIPGSLYAKVLADTQAIDLAEELLVGKHVVVAAPDSTFGSEENSAGIAPIKLHTGEGGKILLLAKQFNLTKVSLYGDKGVTLLATSTIECGSILPQEHMEPYIVTNGALVMATNTNQNIILKHTSITTMGDALLLGQEIQHIGVKLNVGGALTYVGQPVTDCIIERVIEPKNAEVVINDSNAGRCGNWRTYYQVRSYINWDKLQSRCSLVNAGGKLTIATLQGFIGSSCIDLKHGDYTGAPHSPTLTRLKASVSYLYKNQVFHFGEGGRHNTNQTSGYDADYVYHTVPFEYNAHGKNRIIISSPLAIEYNFVGESVEIDLGDNTLTVGRRLANIIPTQSRLTLIKAVDPVLTDSYIQATLSMHNVFTRQPVVPINFVRPNFKIVVLITNTDYFIADPINYPLSHPFIEMQELIATIKYQLGHQSIAANGLSDKEIYYYMLANALEHANSCKPFLEETVIKPMLVYRQLSKHQLKLVSLLPKILDIPELRANIGGMFCRLLTAKGTNKSAIDLLGAIVAQEGYQLDVGRLAILQQYKETQRVIWNKSTSRNMVGRCKTNITTDTVVERTAIEHTGVLKTIKGDGKINVAEFKATGGSIVCLQGHTLMRVRNLLDICGLVNINYAQHSSSAKTIFKKCSTQTFVQHQQIVPFKLITPNGTFTILCDNEIHIEAIQVFAQAGYIYGKNLIELNATKLWQELGPVHTKRGMVLSTTHGSMQTAAPCTFILEKEMIFETAITGSYRDTGSQFIAGVTTVKAGSVEVKPVQLESKIYTKSSGLLGFAYVKTRVTEEHKINQRASYISTDGDLVFHATSKNVTICAISARSAIGQTKFISDYGKVNLLQATDEHKVVTSSKSIGISFTMSEAVMQTMRGDFSKAMQVSLGELSIVRDLKNFFNAEGEIDQVVKGVTAANTIAKSLLALQTDGSMGFISGNLSQYISMTFGETHKAVNFGEIVGNWLLAREIIVTAKENISLTAVNGETQDLYIKSKTGLINIDGGVANECVDEISKSSVISMQSDIPSIGLQSSTHTTRALKHGMSHFKVTGEAYISAIKGDVIFRNAILMARRAYIEAMRLKLESQRDEVIEKINSRTIGTDLKFNKINSHSKWIQEQTGIVVSEDLSIAIEESTALLGSYIEVGAAAIPLKATQPNGLTQDLYELLLPKDSDSGFKVLGIPRAKAISQLFAKAEDPFIRAMVAPEIIQQLRMDNLPETIKPDTDMTSEELLAWANTKECYENYLGFYLALESTALPLNKQQNIGSMVAIAKINDLSLTIWGKTPDNCLHWGVNHNAEGSGIINIALDAKGFYTRLSVTPGMLISPTFSYSDVESTDVSHERGLTMDGLIFGEVVGGIKLRDVKKQQINFAHLSSNIHLQSKDSRPTSHCRQSEESCSKGTIEVDTGIVKKINDIASNLSRLKEVLRQYNPEVQKAKAEAKKVLEQQQLQEAAEQEQHKLVSFLKQRVSDQTEVTGTSKEQSVEDHILLRDQQAREEQRVMAKYGVINSQAAEQRQQSLVEKALDFFIPAAYAEELLYPPTYNRESIGSLGHFDHDGFNRDLLLRFHGSADAYDLLESESSLDRMKREHKNSYTKAVLENDYRQQEQSREKFSWVLTQYRALADKFDETSWYDLVGGTSIKTYTSRIDKDKKDTIHYRNPKDGKFDSSPFDRAMDSFKDGGLNPTKIDGSLKFSDTKDYQVLDFLRSRAKGDNFDIETGGRLFFGGSRSVGSSVFGSGNMQNVGWFIRGSAGFNGASGTAETAFGSSRVDVNGPSGSVNLGAKINTDGTRTNISIGVIVDAKLIDIKGQFKSGKMCFEKYCYKAGIYPAMGIGYGLQGSFGYDADKQRGIDSFNVLAGASLGPVPVMFSSKIILEREPNKLDIDADTQNNNPNTPSSSKPSL